MPLGPSVFSPNVTLISASLGREGGPHSGTGLALSTFCSKTFSDTQESSGLLYKHSQEVQGDPRAPAKSVRNQLSDPSGRWLCVKDTLPRTLCFQELR